MTDQETITVTDETTETKPKKKGKKKSAKKAGTKAKIAPTEKPKKSAKKKAAKEKKAPARKRFELSGKRASIKVDEAFIPLLTKIAKERDLESVNDAAEEILRKGISRHIALANYAKSKA